MDIDLSWLNNNLQRALTRYAKQCTATRLRRLEPNRRHAVLVCFLWQSYLDNIDSMVDMYDKLINKVYKHAQVDVDDHHKNNRKQIRESLFTFKDLAALILDDAVDDACLRQELFKDIDKNDLSDQIEAVDVWLTGKYSHVFNLVTKRFSYIRQFSPALVRHLSIIAEDNGRSDLPAAIDLLNALNEENRRKLPEDAPIGFIPKKIRPLVQVNGTIDKAGWECALLTTVRDEIKAGNISVRMSKRFDRFDNFFISSDQWVKTRETFFKRAGFPSRQSDITVHVQPGFTKQNKKRAIKKRAAARPGEGFELWKTRTNQQSGYPGATKLLQLFDLDPCMHCLLAGKGD